MAAVAQFVEDSQKTIANVTQRTGTLQAKVQQMHVVAEAEGRVPYRADRPDALLDAHETKLIVDVMDWRGKIIERYPSMLLNMAFIYFVALFDALTSDGLRQVLAARPEMMKSGRQISVEDAITHQLTGGLIDYLAGREVTALSYMSFREQTEHYRRRFGIQIVPAEVELANLVELFARRNVLVHNNGVANHAYLALAPNTEGSLGDRLDVDMAYWRAGHDALRRTGIHLCKQFQTKLVA